MQQGIKTKIIPTLLIVIFSLTGCMTYDPYTEEKQISKATAGAAIGAGIAAIGAAIANRDDDPRTRNQRILKATAAGGAIGSGVGYYMDRQEAKLRASLRNSGVRVVRDNDNLILVMPGNITFATDSYELRPDFQDVLNSVSLVLAEFDKTILEVTGHTDSSGSDSYNMQLSERRAQAVSRNLTANSVAQDRILSIGFGESRPIANNSTPTGRTENRRVELVLVPITG
ncbi:MAG: outer membrane protein OmpA-like peptidoglycan-associated protein [Gammaproteobacteria bacterium]|jgi:outer membrane protein OmpA-like peptidoglycan-associated protein